MSNKLGYDPSTTEDSETKTRKKRNPYKPPVLMMHGTIEQLTQAGGGTPTDGPIGSK